VLEHRAVAFDELDHDVVRRALVAVWQWVVAKNPRGIDRRPVRELREELEIPVAGERRGERRPGERDDPVHSSELVGVDAGMRLRDQQEVCEIDSLH
jgi:hypothetical protein